MTESQRNPTVVAAAPDKSTNVLHEKRLLRLCFPGYGWCISWSSFPTWKSLNQNLSVPERKHPPGSSEEHTLCSLSAGNAAAATQGGVCCSSWSGYHLSPRTHPGPSAALMYNLLPWFINLKRWPCFCCVRVPLCPFLCSLNASGNIGNLIEWN